MRAFRTLVATVLLAIALAPAAAAAAPLPPLGPAPALVPAFQATMPDRFGLDADRDGIIDLPNTTVYVHNGVGPARFGLRLDASESRATQAGVALPIVEYRWHITGEGGPSLVRTGPLPVIEVRLPEGSYLVTLDIRADLGWGTATARLEREVAVEDLLVVAVGDSYAAGDGNPERARGPGGLPALWADSPWDGAVASTHAAAHRSTAAWPALAALALERSDPASSVTFVSVAATGARIGAGLLAAGPGAASGQLEQVAALVGERTIDTLLISIGGNDVGFAHVVRWLVDADPQTDPLCYQTDLDNVWSSAADGDWSRGSGVGFTWPWGLECRPTREENRPQLPGLQGLAGELDALAAALEARLHPSAVYLLEYPDPTGAPGGGLCPEIAGDLTPPFGFHEIDTLEASAARSLVLQPLNLVLAEAASRHGWTYVSGVATAFAAGHGYCGTIPFYAPTTNRELPGATGAFPGLSSEQWYRHPATLDPAGAPDGPGVSWYRTAAQSAVLQGPASRWDTTGTLHPNELGHRAMARALLQAMGITSG